MLLVVAELRMTWPLEFQYDVRPAPTRRMPAPSARFALLVVLGVIVPLAAIVVRTGAPVPLTRFCEISESLTLTRAPLVTRMPSWPNSGPVVSRPTDEQLPEPW